MLSKEIGDASICRRMLFSSSFLCKDYPYYWNAVSTFATLGLHDKPKIEVDVCRVLMEHVEVFSGPEAFVSNMNLIQEIVQMKFEPTYRYCFNFASNSLLKVTGNALNIKYYFW